MHSVSCLGFTSLTSCQAYENFTFAKQEFLNQISIVCSFHIASYSGEISYLLFLSDGGYYERVIVIISCCNPWQAHENFIFAKEEFLNRILMFLCFLFQVTSERFHTFFFWRGGCVIIGRHVVINCCVFELLERDQYVLAGRLRTFYIVKLKYIKF